MEHYPSKRQRISRPAIWSRGTDSRRRTKRQDSTAFSHGLQGIGVERLASKSAFPASERLDWQNAANCTLTQERDAVERQHRLVNRQQPAAADVPRGTADINNGTAPVTTAPATLTVAPSAHLESSVTVTASASSTGPYSFTSVPSNLSRSETHSASGTGDVTAAVVSGTAVMSGPSTWATPSEGIIGMSATNGAPMSSLAIMSSPAPTAQPSSVFRTFLIYASGNSTVTRLISPVSDAQGSSSGPDLVSALGFPLTSGARNISTSAYTTVSNSRTTYTGFSTMDLGSAGVASTATLSLSAPSSGTGTGSSSPVTTTLSNGVVSTISGSSSATVTTLSDGTIATISSGFMTTTPATSDAASSGNFATAIPTSSTGAATGVSIGGDSTSAASTASATSAAGAAASNTNTPPPSVIAGGVVGGVAGLAAVLLLAVILLRWYRRRGAMHALSEADTTSVPPSSSAGPHTTERSSFLPFAVAGLSGRRSSPSPTQHRRFEKVSGRKLPSAFSPGLSSPGPFADANASNLSFYNDSRDFPGGSGVPTVAAVAGSSSAGAVDKETMMPGPARTPVLHPGGPYYLAPGSTPPLSPIVPARSSLRPDTADSMGGSHRSYDGSRGSRFTEDVV